MQLVSCERKKFLTYKFILIELISIIIINVLYGYVCQKFSYSDWRVEAREAQQMYSELYDEYLNDSDEEMISICKDELNKVNYSLEHNIPYGIGDAISHMKRMNAFAILLLLLNGILSVNVFLKEYEIKTWKNLFATGESRRKIIISKFIFCIEHALMSLILFIIISFITGAIFLGFNGNIKSVDCENGIIKVSNSLINLGKDYILIFIKLVWYTSISTLLGVIFKEKKISLYIVLLIIIFEEKIDEFLKLLTIHKAIPIYYFNMGSDFVANHIGMVLAICFTYIVSNIFIATILIDRQEIKT